MNSVVPRALDEVNQASQPEFALRGYLYEQARRRLANLLAGTPNPTPLPQGTLTASPSTLPPEGGTVTLTWSSTNATSASLEPGIGPVALSGSQTVPVTATTTFHLVLSNATGTRTRSAQVTVTKPADPPGVNILQNPGFEAGKSAWYFYTNTSGKFEVVSPGYADDYTAKITINETGSNVQLFQPDLVLEPNKQYTLSFAAYSSTGHNVRLTLIQHSSPYTDYGLYFHEFDLQTFWDIYTVSFTTKGFTSVVNDGRLFFWFAVQGLPGDEYYIDNISLGQGNIPTVPTAPRMNFPEQNAVNQPLSLTLTWAAPPGAESYQVQVATDSSFRFVVFNDPQVQGTSRVISGLNNSTTYYARVRARNTVGLGPFSPTRIFTTQAATPDQPVLLVPASGDPEVAPVFTARWTRIRNANSYLFQVARDSLFQTVVAQDSAAADTFRTVGPLEIGKRHFARVRATAAGVVGPFSNVHGFTVRQQGPSDLPVDFTLEANFPNPFNPTTTIRYALPTDVDVRIVLYDLLGREVDVLVNEFKRAGVYDFPLTMTGKASGVYFYTIQAGGFRDMRKLVFLQ
jgi:hypothetical protein